MSYTKTYTYHYIRKKACNKIKQKGFIINFMQHLGYECYDSRCVNTIPMRQTVTKIVINFYLPSRFSLCN